MRTPIYIIWQKGDINKCFQISDLVVGVYSTALIEALELGKQTHLIRCAQAEVFEDLLREEMVVSTLSIKDSLEILSRKQGTNSTLSIREPFKANGLINLIFISMNTPLVSIITPVFNAEKLVENCIDSVRTQSLQDYEHILVGRLFYGS